MEILHQQKCYHFITIFFLWKRGKYATNKEIPEKRYIPPEKRQNIIDKIKLK